MRQFCWPTRLRGVKMTPMKASPELMLYAKVMLGVFVALGIFSVVMTVRLFLRPPISPLVKPDSAIDSMARHGQRSRFPTSFFSLQISSLFSI